MLTSIKIEKWSSTLRRGGSVSLKRRQHDDGDILFDLKLFSKLKMRPGLVLSLRPDLNQKCTPEVNKCPEQEQQLKSSGIRLCQPFCGQGSNPKHNI